MAHPFEKSGQVSESHNSFRIEPAGGGDYKVIDYAGNVVYQGPKLDCEIKMDSHLIRDLMANKGK